MSYEVQEALNEIMDMPPMFRRDFIVNYIRMHLPAEEAKRLYFEKDKQGYIRRMVNGGFALDNDLLNTIGKERILRYFHTLSRQS